MAYARIPDTFPFAEAVVDAGNHAIGAWARMLAWTAGNGRDGFVPTPVAAMIASRKEIGALVSSGLVVSVTGGEVHFATGRVSDRPDVEVVMPSDGLWLIDFLTWNISAAEAKGLSVRGRKAGQASAAARLARAAAGGSRTPQAERVGEQSVQPQAADKSNGSSNERPNRQDKSRQDKEPEDTGERSSARRFDPIAATARADFPPADSISGANAARERHTRTFAVKSISRPETFS